MKTLRMIRIMQRALAQIKRKSDDWLVDAAGIRGAAPRFWLYGDRLNRHGDDVRLTEQEISEVVENSLAEDIGSGDATSLLTVPGTVQATAEFVAREGMVVAGLEVAAVVFRKVEPSAQVTALVQDGDRVEAGDILLRIKGLARGILTAERVALNFVQRLSGVATLTARYVEAVAGTGVEILDTRKTTPGLRLLEKYAVACGGGVNHRMGLHDMVMIKDNHLAALSLGEGGDSFGGKSAIEVAISRARAGCNLKIEVEADTLEQAVKAAECGADIILLDNMEPAVMADAVKQIAGRSRTEASGGIDLSTVRAAAESGVDCISVGALTHSAPAVDIGLDFVLEEGEGTT